MISTCETINFEVIAYRIVVPVRAIAKTMMPRYLWSAVRSEWIQSQRAAMPAQSENLVEGLMPQDWADEVIGDD